MATILIADPDSATRSLLELLCGRLGHRPVVPSDWDEDEKPDLLVLEPASDPDLRIARSFRGRFPQLPILCVSIDGPNAETATLDPVAHLMKPFLRSQLERAIEQALVSTPETVE